MSDVNLQSLVVSDEHRHGGLDWRFFLSALLALLVLAWIGYEGWQAWKPRRPVTLAPVQVKTDVQSIRSASFEAAGWVEPEPFATTVASLVEGWVTKVHAIEGDAVKKGDLLVELYDEDYKLEIERLQALVEVALANLAYVDAQLAMDQKLVEAKALDVLAVKRTAADRARCLADLKRLEVDVTLAQRNLERCKVVAPMGGVVLRRNVMPGYHIVPIEHKFALMTMYHPEKLQVRVDVNLVDVERMQLQQQCEVRLESLPDQVFDGQVVSIMHEADNQKNTVQAKVRILSPLGKFKPEMLVRVRFLAPEIKEASTEQVIVLYIPKAAVVERDGDSFVFVASGHGRSMVAKKIQVTKGSRQLEDLIEIESGLDPTSKVIISQPSLLRDGEAIQSEQP